MVFPWLNVLPLYSWVTLSLQVVCLSSSCVIVNRRVVLIGECPSRPDLASVWCWLDPFAMMVSLVDVDADSATVEISSRRSGEHGSGALVFAVLAVLSRQCLGQWLLFLWLTFFLVHCCLGRAFFSFFMSSWFVCLCVCCCVEFELRARLYTSRRTLFSPHFPSPLQGSPVSPSI